MSLTFGRWFLPSGFAPPPHLPIHTPGPLAHIRVLGPRRVLSLLSLVTNRHCTTYSDVRSILLSGVSNQLRGWRGERRERRKAWLWLEKARGDKDKGEP